MTKSTNSKDREHGIHAKDGGFLEEGEALRQLSGLATRGASGAEREHFDVIVIGAGQAGLSVGYYLKKLGLRFAILDAHERVGDVWRKRWDSLRLFTPARLDSLVGLPFPARPDAFPTKDEMADYLESYAKHFALPVRCGVRVEHLTRRNGGYVLETSAGQLQADHVVIAMASFQKPRVPEFASELPSSITQLHSSAYRSPSQLKPGPVLLAGAGNSGAEIAVDLSRAGHPVFMAGRDTGYVPFRVGSFLGRKLLAPFLLRVVFHRLLTLRTPMGRKARPKIVSQGGALIRTRPAELERAGVQRTPRVEGVRAGKPLLADGRELEVANVVWCTGYHPGFSFVELDVFGENGDPRHERGVVKDEPGLYFVGLNFLYAMSSTMIHGVGRDAQHVVAAIAERVRRPATAGTPHAAATAKSVAA